VAKKRREATRYEMPEGEEKGENGPFTGHPYENQDNAESHIDASTIITSVGV